MTKKTTVLVVEDSPTQGVRLQLTLESQGFEVGLVDRLEHALTRLDASAPDVLLLDLILPDATGLDGLGEILARRPETPVVVLTGLDDENLAVEAVKQGAQDYLVKGTHDASLLSRTIRYAIERQRIHRQLESLTQELRVRNSDLHELNEQKNRFLAMAAHDLRSPLAVNLSFSKFLLDRFADGFSDSQREFISRIRGNSEFMLRLIDDLLDISKIEAGKLELQLAATDLGALIERNLALNRVLAERKSIRISFRADADLVPAWVDPLRIEQVLNNLLSNAIKYSHPDTCIEVALEASDGGVALSVRDQGQGIPGEEIDRLFRPFEMTSVKSTDGEKSTGLGLAIVRKIVSGHAGDISVDSVVGEGTTFRVWFPGRTPAAAAEG